MTVKRTTKAKTATQLHGEDLEARRADDRWEEHNGETDTVACRICGQRWAYLGSHGRTNHLQKDDGLTVLEYRKYCSDHGWGTPPIRSLKNQETIAKWRDENPEAIKASGRKKKAKDKLRRRTEPQFLEHEHKQVRELQQRKLSEADKAIRVRCEECPTPTWYLAFGRHLSAVHKMSIARYKVLHPDAPTVAAESRQKQSKHSKRLWADRKQKSADVERLQNVEGLDLKTGLRASLAAHWTLLLEGKSQYEQAQAICQRLYSDSTDPLNATKQFLRRWPQVIEDEKQRVAKLDGDQRQMEVKDLEPRLKRELAKPLKKAS